MNERIVTNHFDGNVHLTPSQEYSLQYYITVKQITHPAELPKGKWQVPIKTRFNRLNDVEDTRSNWPNIADHA